MTSAARRDVSPIGLCIRRVTAKTSDVSIQSRRNRESNTITISPVTRGASSVAVFCVIELRVETTQWWKYLELSTLHICMTNGADLARWICELLRVTTCARRMRCFTRQGGLR